MDSSDSTASLLTSLTGGDGGPPSSLAHTLAAFTNTSLPHQEVVQIHYPRAATLFAAICSIIFIIVGVAGEYCRATAITNCRY